MMENNKVPPGWKTAPLDDLLLTKNAKSKQIKSTEYGNVGAFPVIDQSSRFICGYSDATEKVIDVDLPIIIFGDHTRHTKLVTFPFVPGADGTQLLKPKDGTDEVYFYYLVSFAAGKIGNYGYDRHFKHLKDFQAVYPASKSEQQKIAHILQTIDRAIEHTEALIDKYQQIKAGLMHDLFTRGIGPNGQLRPPRDQAPELYQQTPIGWIPKEWGFSFLGGIVNPSRPVVYGILMPGYGCDGGVPVVKVKDIKNGKIDIDNLLLTSPNIDHEYRRSRLKKNDILLTIRGSVGRICLVPEDLEDANITQDTARIDIANGCKKFYRYFLETEIPAKFISTNTLGVAVQGINLRDVRKIPAVIPEIEEQEDIAEKIVAITHKINSEKRKLEKLQKQKSGLMHDLLTGKVPVTVDAAAPEATHD